MVGKALGIKGFSSVRIPPSPPKQKPLIFKKNLGNQGLFAASAYGLRPVETGRNGCKRM
nr:MAG TPA: hypothetical protein [Caudoviricetes sp.]